MTTNNLGLNLDRLDAYLCDSIPDFAPGPLTAKKFSDGQSNPTFLLTKPERQYVLRRKPPGQLLKSAHAVDREYRVLSALQKTDVPVPKVYHLCEDDGVIGSMFYIMEYVDGRVFWDPALPELLPGERSVVYDQMAQVLAAIHSVDLEASGLESYGRPGNYFERQVTRWTQQYRASQTDTLPAMDNLIEWLSANLPPDNGRISLIHGDYRIDNLMFANDRLEIIGVFDWELSTLGHPVADLAYQVMQRYMGRDWEIKGLAGLDCSALGIPSEQAYMASYCQRMGLAGIDHWPFFLAFSFFRFAAICQGVKHRALQGNASADNAERVGTMAAPLAELGWAIVCERG